MLQLVATEEILMWMLSRRALPVDTGVPPVVLSSLADCVLQVVSSAAEELRFQLMYFISYSCMGRSSMGWKLGSSSRQVAPSSILERQRGGGLLIYTGSGGKVKVSSVFACVRVCVCQKVQSIFFYSLKSWYEDGWPHYEGF